MKSMRIFPPPTHLVIHSPLSSTELWKRISENVDFTPPQAFWVIRPRKPIHARRDGRRLILMTPFPTVFPTRRHWRRLRAILTLEFFEEKGGTRIEGTLDCPKFMKVALPIVAAGWVAWVPVFIIGDFGWPSVVGNPYLLLAAIPLVLPLIIIPKALATGRAMSGEVLTRFVSGIARSSETDNRYHKWT